ncbi:MTAP family purine nucleoside phosphorylase, partial [Candidatus Woesearchaeota archaeon]|nr:MTAP family purine nucleoside phosphorylase [Candidatus Woesearchaeota archaeon]
NYRANIWAMKELGVTHILAPTAVGSLQKHVAPGDLVFVDQFIDRTTKRAQTFYDGNQICHIPMAEPFCLHLRKLLADSATTLKLPHHSKGTVVTIEGPRFSTKAESHMFRLFGGDVINMTTVPEVVLAREAGICYSAIAMSTDYDCWHESEAPVTLEMILSTMKKNAENVKKLLLDVIPKIIDVQCKCHEDIKTSLL